VDRVTSLTRLIPVKKWRMRTTPEATMLASYILSSHAKLWRCCTTVVEVESPQTQCWKHDFWQDVLCKPVLRPLYVDPLCDLCLVVSVRISSLRCYVFLAVSGRRHSSNCLPERHAVSTAGHFLPIPFVRPRRATCMALRASVVLNVSTIPRSV